MFSRLQRTLAWVSLIGAFATIGACGPIEPVEVPPPTAVIPSVALKVDLPDGQAGVARSAGRLRLFLAGTDGAFFEATSNPDHPGTTAIHLMSYGGETGRTSNSFIFGNAP